MIFIAFFSWDQALIVAHKSKIYDFSDLWREEAAKLKIKKVEIDRMASAFEHEDFQLATRPVCKTGKITGF